MVRDCFERVNHDLLRFAQFLTNLAHADK